MWFLMITSLIERDRSERKVKMEECVTISYIYYVVPYVVPYEYKPNDRKREGRERERGNVCVFSDIRHLVPCMYLGPYVEHNKCPRYTSYIFPVLSLSVYLLCLSQYACNHKKP